MKNLYIIERKTKENNWIIDDSETADRVYFTNLKKAKKELKEAKEISNNFRLAKYKYEKVIDNSWKQTREMCS